jgi:hypothetical protein
MATDPGDIETFIDAVCSNNPWKYDETAIFAPWRSVTVEKPLRIGWLVEDDHHPLHPPTLRVMKEARCVLEAAGHCILPVKNFPSINEALKISFHLFGMDPDGTPFTHIAKSGEPEIPSIAKSLLPESERLAPSLERLYDLTEHRDAIKAQAHKVMVDLALDVVLMPGNAGPASPHDTYGLPPYTVFLNLLEVCISSKYLICSC